MSWWRVCGSGSENRTIKELILSDCYTPVDKGEERCEVLFKELKEASNSHTVGLIHFNLPVSC